MKTCCATGHRPQGFPWEKGKDEKLDNSYLHDMEKLLTQMIEDGYTHFISGGALGVDQDFALTVLKLKKTFPHITLTIVKPCDNQDKKWKNTDKILYQTIQTNADEVICLHPHYTRGCMQERNRYMVEHSDTVLAWWNGENSGGTYYTQMYAQKKGIPLKITHLIDYKNN